jgi:DNA polymerase-4
MALRLCPDAIVVPPRIEAYTEASRAVFELFEDTTPMVEGISIDEAFLDVGGLLRVSGEPVDIARRLRSRVRSEVGLPITVGVARTKFLAKVASGVAKPDGLLAIAPGTELDFLHPLPVERLWGVGHITAEKLHQRGIATVGEVAELSNASLSAMLGPGSGRHLHALAHNYDPRPVLGRRRRSIGSQRAFGLRPVSPADLDEMLVGIIDRVARRLRKAERLTRTVVLRMRFHDFTRATRSRTLHRATSRTQALLTAARELLEESMPLVEARGLTLIGITLANLDDADAVQAELPFEKHDGERLDHALDEVKSKYGRDAVTRAVLLGKDQGITVPLLPD